MQFEPVGGFPSIVRIDDTNITGKTLETRGFATTNIASINDIMNLKKKENLFIAFGTDDEDGTDFNIEAMFPDRAYKFDNIIYKKKSSMKRIKN